MQAVNYYIIVEKIKQAPKTVGGLVLTEDTDKDNRYDKGKVISSGNLAVGVELDDVIYFDKHAGNPIRRDEKVYHVITIKDVVIIE